MSASAIQHRSAWSGAATSLALAFSSSNTAGNLLVYATGTDHPANIATDSNANTITNALNVTPGSSGCGRIDYAANCNAGANTVTAHQSNGTSIHIHIYELSGCATTTPVTDTGSVNSSATPSVSTSGTAANVGDAVFAFFYDFPNNDSLVAGSGYSVSDFSNDTSAGDSALSEFKAATAGGTQTATLTGNGTSTLQQLIVVFSQPAGGGTFNDSISIALSALLSSSYFWYKGAFDNASFDNASFFVYVTGVDGAITLTITTSEVTINTLSAVVTVSIPTAVSAAMVGNFIASVASVLSLTTAYSAGQTLGINTATSIATSTALAMAAGFTFADAITLAGTTGFSTAYQLAINGSSSFAITMNEIVGAILNANGSAAFAASLLETSSVVLNALASSQFSATMAEVTAGTLNINAVDQIAASLNQQVLGGFTFASSTALSSSMAMLTASAFSFFGTAALSATTGYSVADTLNAAGLLTLGVTTGYSLAKTLNAVASANFPVTTNDVVSAAGSTYGVSIPLAIHPVVNAISTAIMNALLNAGISTHVATDATNLIVEAIALGIVTAYSDDAVKNALQIAALVAESIRVVQQLTAENINVDQQLVAELANVVEQLTAESLRVTQQLTAENIKTEI